MNESVAARALRACRDYHHWASEIRRLTDEIGGSVCPHETHDDNDGGAVVTPSCFAREKDVTIPGMLIDDGPRPRFLFEVRDAVKDCSACRDLCDLIAARRHARKMWGAAKRSVRAAAKASQ